MKISKPITVDPPSHKNMGGFLPRPGFDEFLRDDIRSMARQGMPVTMRGGKLFYHNNEEGVHFASIIKDLENINQGRPNWVSDSFQKQIWVERVLKALSVHDVKELDQDERGLLNWRWHEHDFGAYGHRDAFLCLGIADSENYRADLCPLTGSLTPVFMLDSMQKSERGLAVQLKLQVFLEKEKRVTAVFVPNGMDVDLVRIKVGLDGTYTCSHANYKTPPEAQALGHIRGYVEEFKAFSKAALEEKKSEGAIDASSLDLA